MSNLQTLPITGSSGLQTATQSPQTSTQSSLAAQAENVQTGTAASLLASGTGIPLHATTVPTVGLTSTSSTSQTAASQAVHHGPNPLLVGFSGLLFVVAIVLFVGTFRSAKNTTK